MLWTKDELDFLKNNLTLSKKQLAEKLGRTQVAVYIRKKRLMRELNIYTKAYRPWSAEEIEFLKNNYNKIPAREIAKNLNRTKSSIFSQAEVLKLSSKVLFGQKRKEFNRLIIPKRGIRYQKNKNGKWDRAHIVLWEKHHGPIPEKYIVSFKDGVKQNLNIENLVLITRSELAKNDQKKRYGELASISTLNNELRKMTKGKKHD